MRNDDELRRLLGGGPIPAEDEQLAQVLRELRSALSSRPPEDVAEDHLAAITAAAADAAHGAPTVAPVGRLRRWGRRVSAAGALKIATAATVAAAATGGGLAASGDLPQPVQERVSDVLSRVGITVPSGETADGQPDEIGTTPAEPAVVDSAPPTSTPPVETPADEQAPVDPPADTTAEPDDDPEQPFDEPPEGEPDETPSDTGDDRRIDPPRDGTGEAPAAADASEERSGEADADAVEDDASDEPPSGTRNRPGDPD